MQLSKRDLYLLHQQQNNGVVNPIAALEPVAWYRAGEGITVTGAGVSMWADQADSDNSLVLPGVNANRASAPDSVPLSITGDIDLIVKANVSDWSPAAATAFIGKASFSGGQDAYYFGIAGASGGLLRFIYSPDGTTLRGANSSAVSGITDGTNKWCRVTYASATGKVNFYLSDDGATWSALGTEQSLTAGAIFDGTTILTIGTDGAGTSALTGKIYRAIIKSGIDGTTVFDANFAAQAKGTTSFAESSSNAATVTVNQSGALPAHIGSQKDLLQGTDGNRAVGLIHSGENYLYLPGVNSNTASTPNAAPIQLTTDIDIRMRVALVDWSPAAVNALISKFTSTGNQRTFYLYVTIGGALILQTSADGITARVATSSVATGITDGAAAWIRVTRAAASGDVKFYTAADSTTMPSSWTQLGTTQSTTAEGLFNSSANLFIGAYDAGASGNCNGKVYRAAIYSTIGGTTPVFDADFTRVSDNATTFAESSSNGATVTINSTGALKAQIVGSTRILFDGVDNYLKTNAFTLNQPETVYLVVNQISWTGFDRFCDGYADSTMVIDQFTATPQIRVYAGTALSNNSNLAVGAYGVFCAVFNGANSVSRVNNTTEITGNAGALNAGGFTLGAPALGSANWANIAVKECAIFASAHDATTRSQIVSYLMAKHSIT